MSKHIAQTTGAGVKLGRMGRLFAVLILAIPALATCAESSLPRTTGRVGDVEFQLEIASDPDSRAQGLMFREELGEREGMVFVFPDSQQRSFWMRNTVVPLSIAFLASDGTIREIYDMQPESERLTRSRGSTGVAVEVLQGAFERAGISVGDRFVFDPPLPRARD